jgi:uncharacterized LabA/DUF88 family protein
MAGYVMRLRDEGWRSKMTGATESIERVAAYIDGFNLYYGIHQGGRRHLWLDLEGLARSLLKPHQQLVAVRYFTAPVRDDPAALSRQQLYWNALSAHSSLLEIRVGRFQRKSKRCFSCNNSWFEYEEKESDVALGAAIVADGARAMFDTAMIISADSDMVSAVRELKSLVPEVRVVAAFPPNRDSSELKRNCDAFMRIGDAKIRQAQLPETVWAGGHSITRPDHWK